MKFKAGIGPAGEGFAEGQTPDSEVTGAPDEYQQESNTIPRLGVVTGARGQSHMIEE